ncbi:MAG: p-hydroxycinnamoyl CoA hydratase/lyase [Chloroflexi bacterium]|nr:p-hydroxycinnamoyl CoA hydratase/lyase [Chloroflexota bacterium]
MTKDLKTLTVDVEDQIATITINRPEKKNAMNPQFDLDLDVALDSLAEDDDAKAVILTGAGDTFCGGRDLKEFFAATYDKPKERLRAFRKSAEVADKLRLFPKVTIAAVNGPVFGGGVRLMSGCDIAIASDRARFGLSEINFGIFPGGGVMKNILELLPHRDALFMALTGDPIDAATGAQMRLVNKVVPHEKLREETRALAAKFKTKNPIAVMMTKEVFWSAKYMTYNQAVAWEFAKGEELSRLQDGEWVREGIGKFLKGEYKPGLGSYMEKK